MNKIIDKKRSIGNAAKEVGIKTHVIRFWESKFPQIKPKIGKGSRRYYFDKEIAVLNKIKSLLYEEGYSISGLQNLLKKRKESNLQEQNIKFLLMEEQVGNSNKTPTNSASSSAGNYQNNLDLETKISINQIIAKIELNLQKLQQ